MVDSFFYYSICHLRKLPSSRKNYNLLSGKLVVYISTHVRVFLVLLLNTEENQLGNHLVNSKVISCLYLLPLTQILSSQDVIQSCLSSVFSCFVPNLFISIIRLLRWLVNKTRIENCLGRKMDHETHFQNFPLKE